MAAFRRTDTIEGMPLLPSRTLAVSVARPPNEVYAFIVAPLNLSRWAAGLAESATQSDGGWLVQMPDGPARLEFAPENAYRVADHRVTTSSGVTVLNPMRVLANGDGSEVLFTLFQAPSASHEAFAADAAAVEFDLQTLKRVLEAGDA